jgi:hypothetical protein
MVAGTSCSKGESESETEKPRDASGVRREHAAGEKLQGETLYEVRSTQIKYFLPTVVARQYERQILMPNQSKKHVSWNRSDCAPRVTVENNVK